MLSNLTAKMNLEMVIFEVSDLPDNPMIAPIVNRCASVLWEPGGHRRINAPSSR